MKHEDGCLKNILKGIRSFLNNPPQVSLALPTINDIIYTYINILLLHLVHLAYQPPPLDPIGIIYLLACMP